MSHISKSKKVISSLKGCVSDFPTWEYKCPNLVGRITMTPNSIPGYKRCVDVGVVPYDSQIAKRTLNIRNNTTALFNKMTSFV